MALTDRQMFKMSRRMKAYQNEVTELNKKVTKIKLRLLDEMERRGVDKIQSSDGVTITFVQAEIPQYDPVAILDALTPAQRRKVLADPQIDLGRLSQQIQAGKINQSVLAENTSMKKNAPYVLVNITGDATE